MHRWRMIIAGRIEKSCWIASKYKRFAVEDADVQTNREKNKKKQSNFGREINIDKSSRSDLSSVSMFHFLLHRKESSFVCRSVEPFIRSLLNTHD